MLARKMSGLVLVRFYILLSNSTPPSEKLIPILSHSVLTDRYHNFRPTVSIPFLLPCAKNARAKLHCRPFDGTNTTCYLAQFFNAIYVLNGDAKNPNSIYIYDAGAKSWSTQPTTPGSFDYSSFDAILDHDTNVFCT